MSHFVMIEDMEKKEIIIYTPLTLEMAIDLAAPHTWPAAIIPAFLGLALSSFHGPISISISLTILIIVVLMQSSVNTFNDYFDYIKGTDSIDDGVAKDDAVLVYNNINPKSVLKYAIGLLVAAFLLGFYIVIVSGWIPLVIAAIGGLFVVIYSAGKSPISYLPLGEFVSGFVMGGLIPLATFASLIHELNMWVLLWSMPTIINVGLIMFTNNTCDIEKDIPSGRRTLSILMGREASRRLYDTLLLMSLFFVIFNVTIWFISGMILLPFMLLTLFPLLKALLKNKLTKDTRIQAMQQILNVNIIIGLFYGAAILTSSQVTFIF